MKYKKDNIVGFVADCMAEGRIVKLIPKRKGYEIECLRIHLADPQSSTLKMGKHYFLPEKNIVVVLLDTSIVKFNTSIIKSIKKKKADSKKKKR